MVKITHDIEELLNYSHSLTRWAIAVAVIILLLVLSVLYVWAMRPEIIISEAPYAIDGQDNDAQATERVLFNYDDRKPLDIDYLVFNVLPKE